MIQPLLRKTAVATLSAALAAAAIIVAFSSSPASTQTPLPLLSATGCTDGTFVDTSTHPVIAGPNNDLVDDCQVLVAIQNHWAANSFESNHLLRTWGTTTQKIGTWSGITVSSSRVSTLNLTRKGLAGSIPAAIGNLTNLTSLYLDDNSLSGSIPTAIGNLTNLAVLNLSHNALTGNIPAELGNLTNLTNLWLSYNNLSGSIPAELSRLAPSQGGKIRVFTICSRSNRFTGPVPAALRSLGSDLSCVSGSSTPSTSSTTTRAPIAFIPIPVLSQTNCSDGTFVDMTAYPVVAGANNDLADDCKALVAMQNHWAINANAMGQSQQLSSNHPLRESKHPLRVWGTTAQKINTWEGITVTSGRISSFDFNSNVREFSSFYGSIPAEIGNLTNLTYLHFGNSVLSGSIPTEIGNLTNLTWLDLSTNYFVGSIPAEIGNLTRLTWLNLQDNSLTGNIPTELGNLTNLTRLYLDNNSLTGKIPAELSNLTNLTWLSIERNRLTGSIPTELSSLARSRGGKLTTFLFCYNLLSGTVPTAFRSGVVIHRPNHEYNPDSETACLNADPPVDPDGTEEESDSGTENGEDRTTSTTTTSTVPSGDGGSSPLWNTLTIEQTGTTPAQIRQTLGLASNQAIYAWDAQTQTWERLANPNLRIPQDTMLTFRTEQAISQENLDELNLARGTQRTTLAAGWNIISIPEAITRTSDSTGFLLADELTDCDAGTAVMAVANYSARDRAWQIWLPCNPAAQTRLTTGANPPYRPLTAIAPADTTYIYSRSAQTIAWNSDTQTYQTSTS